VPIYEYQCVRCQAVRDVKHGFKEANTETCPTCGGELKRLFNPAGIVFKGSGFYINDSRKSTGDAKSESKSEAKSESKPDAPKSESKGKGDAAA
jgi:putative FmdB family regulatory protein